MKNSRHITGESTSQFTSGEKWTPGIPNSYSPQDRFSFGLGPGHHCRHAREKWDSPGNSTSNNIEMRLKLYFRQNGVNAADNDDAELFVVLCHDILLEIFQHGSRRQLVKLQRIGRRFHKMIETYFREKPFLRLHFRLAPGFVSLIFNSEMHNKNSQKIISPFQSLFYLLTILGMDLNALF